MQGSSSSSSTPILSSSPIPRSSQTSSASTQTDKQSVSSIAGNKIGLSSIPPSLSQSLRSSSPPILASPTSNPQINTSGPGNKSASLSSTSKFYANASSTIHYTSPALTFTPKVTQSSMHSNTMGSSFARATPSKPAVPGTSHVNLPLSSSISNQTSSTGSSLAFPSASSTRSRAQNMSGKGNTHPPSGTPVTTPRLSSSSHRFTTSVRSNHSASSIPTSTSAKSSNHTSRVRPSTHSAVHSNSNSTSTHSASSAIFAEPVGGFGSVTDTITRSSPLSSAPSGIRSGSMSLKAPSLSVKSGANECLGGSGSTAVSSHPLNSIPPPTSSTMHGSSTKLALPSHASSLKVPAAVESVIAAIRKINPGWGQ